MQVIDVEKVNSFNLKKKLRFTTKDVILYAIGVGEDDLRFVYEKHKDFSVLPSFSATFLWFFEGTFDVSDFNKHAVSNFPGFDSSSGSGGFLKIVHGDQQSFYYHPLNPRGMEIELEYFVSDVTQKGKNVLMHIVCDLRDSTNGILYCRNVMGAMLLGYQLSKTPMNFLSTKNRQGTSDERKESKSGTSSFSKKVAFPKQSEIGNSDMNYEEKSIEFQVSKTQNHIYRLSGDYNPLHVDPQVAKAFGFKDCIMHGLWTFGFLTSQLLKQTFVPGRKRIDPSQLVEIGGRFVSPVYPGERIRWVLILRILQMFWMLA